MATERIHTYCAMCISRCGVIATVRDGRFEKVSMDPEHPNGCICIKGTSAPEIVYSSDRLRHPLKRTRPKSDADPGWIPIPWDEAMSIVASRLLEIRERVGPEAVVFGRATTAGGSTVDFEAWLTRLANAFGSPNLLTPTTSAPGTGLRVRNIPMVFRRRPQTPATLDVFCFGALTLRPANRGSPNR